MSEAVGLGGLQGAAGCGFGGLGVPVQGLHELTGCGCSLLYALPVIAADACDVNRKHH